MIFSKQARYGITSIRSIPLLWDEHASPKQDAYARPGSLGQVPLPRPARPLEQALLQSAREPPGRRVPHRPDPGTSFAVVSEAHPGARHPGHVRAVHRHQLGASARQAAAELVGYDVRFHIDDGNDTRYVLAQGLAGTGPVFSIARREAGKVGVSIIEEVQAELAVSGHEYSPEGVSRILQSSTKIDFLDDQWFWMPNIPPERNRLCNVTQRMLSVTPRLEVGTIRQGLHRHYRYRQIDLVPPVTVLKAFYSAHPEFVLTGDATVESIKPLDYRDTLGDVEQAFVEVLRTSPTGLMDRAELEEEVVTRRSVNANTFSVFSSYSPILDHPATNVWCLRGHAVNPAQLEALRTVIATRPRQRRALAYGWDEDGNLWLTVGLGNVNTPVVGIPVSISRYVAGRRFQGRTQEGTPAGVIAIDENGASWGYGPFLRRRGAEPGDVLTLGFDLVSEEVTLSLDDESVLLDEAG
jgi:hypothetical protein